MGVAEVSIKNEDRIEEYDRLIDRLLFKISAAINVDSSSSSSTIRS